VRLPEAHDGYDPTNRESAYAHVHACQQRGEIATGLLFLDETGQDMHAVAKTVATPLVDVPYAELCPGSAALDQLMEKYR
jgi:2-oxoglutarate/2-oxoacid ferredoxin oxidoreductase subunit beta